MRVIIMGCGQTGSRLAGMLDDENHEVTVIDWSAGAFTRLPDGFAGHTILGNALDQDVLKNAGVSTADAFVAATSGDNRNIVASEIARCIFSVPRVVARIKDPNRAGYFGKLGLKVDCRTTAGAQILIDLVQRELSEEPA